MHLSCFDFIGGIIASGLLAGAHRGLILDYLEALDKSRISRDLAIDALIEEVVIGRQDIFGSKNKVGLRVFRCIVGRSIASNVFALRREGKEIAEHTALNSGFESIVDSNRLRVGTPRKNTKNGVNRGRTIDFFVLRFDIRLDQDRHADIDLFADGAGFDVGACRAQKGNSARKDGKREKFLFHVLFNTLYVLFGCFYAHDISLKQDSKWHEQERSWN